MAIPLRNSWLAQALEEDDRLEWVSERNARKQLSVKNQAGSAFDLDAFRRGDAHVFETLIAEVVPALVRYAGRIMHDTAGAEDVVHDTLARLWHGRATIIVATTIRAYLFGAVRNAALNARKHERVEHTYAQHSAPSLQDGNDADTVIGKLTVEQLLAHLPERRREAVVLRYLGELSYADIALVLRTTPGNAERLVARSLETLRELVATR